MGWATITKADIMDAVNHVEMLVKEGHHPMEACRAVGEAFGIPGREIFKVYREVMG